MGESAYPNDLHFIQAGIELRILRITIKLLSNRRLNLAEEKVMGCGFKRLPKNEES